MIQVFTVSVYDPADFKAGKSTSEYKQVKVEVIVDFHALATQMTRKAYYNKSQLAKECKGAVMVSVRS